MKALAGIGIVLALVVGFVYGWVANIITLVNTETLTMSGETIARVIGIVVGPLGAVMGYF